MGAKPVVYFIDDSATMREVIKIAFRREELEVITCHDAGSALDLMEHNAPDVVITDVIMPGRDGYDVCEHIRTHPRFAKTPVILMSGVVNKGVAERAFAVQANELIRKPFQPQDLIARVRHLLAVPVEAAPAPQENEAATAVLSSIFSGPMPSRAAYGQPRMTPGGPVPHPPRSMPSSMPGSIPGNGNMPRPAAHSIAATVAAAMQPAVAAPPVSIPGAQITGAIQIPVPPPAPGRVPTPPLSGNGSDMGRMRLEAIRLQSQIKKLEAELAAEREYTKALEQHVTSLQEVDESEQVLKMLGKEPQNRSVLPGLFIFFLFLCCLACNKPPEQTTIQTISATNRATISDVRFYSQAIGRNLWYRIILPTPSGNERFPVLYLLHGANSSPIEVAGSSEVAKLAVAERLAVVIPNGEYSYYTNAKHRRDARWEDAITLDLPQDVGARFPVLVGREHSGIAGISMGGYGAAKLALKHPELYGFSGIISGSLDITRRPASLRRCWQTWRIWTIFGFRRSTRTDEDVFDLIQNPNQLRQTIWFASCGKSDPLHDVNERFARQIRQHGVEVKLITTVGGHDWQSWNAAMPQMFKAAGEALRPDRRPAS